MTQQKPLPIATRIAVDLISPSSFHPEVLHRDKIWHMPPGKSGAAAKQRSVGRRKGRGVEREAWSRGKSALQSKSQAHLC